MRRIRSCWACGERYEAHHKLRYTDDSLMAASKFSSQYISDRFLPDKVRLRLMSAGASQAGRGCASSLWLGCNVLLRVIVSVNNNDSNLQQFALLYHSSLPH